MKFSTKTMEMEMKAHREVINQNIKWLRRLILRMKAI